MLVLVKGRALKVNVELGCKVQCHWEINQTVTVEG